MNLKILIEQRTKNSLLYIPALKMFMTGESKTAGTECLKETISAFSMEDLHRIQDNSLIEFAEGGYLYIIEHSPTDDRSFGYIPALDLSVVGET